MPRRIGSLPPHLLLPLAAYLVLAVLALGFPIADTDVWFHLAAGREMFARGALLRVDPFCTSSLGAAWIDLHWGFQALCLGLWKLGGPAALVTAKTVALAAAFLLAAGHGLHGRRGAWTLAYAGFALVLARHLVDVRPLFVTLLLLAAILRLFEEHGRGSVKSGLWGCVALQIGLANVQGLFLLGPAFAGAISLGAWFERRRHHEAPAAGRREVLVVAAMALAGLATPYAWDSFRLAGRVLLRILPGNIFSGEIAENAPFWRYSADQPLHALAILWALLLLAAVWRGGRGAPGRALVVLGAAALSLAAIRNLPLLLLAAVWAFAASMAEAERDAMEASPGNGVRVPSRSPFSTRVSGGIRTAWGARWVDAARLAWSPWVHAGAAALLLGCLALPSARSRAWDLPGSLVAPMRVPERAVDLIERRGLFAPVFHELRYGGYLAWRLYPRMRCFVDGRMVLRSADFFAGFLDVVDHPWRFPSYAQEHGFELVLLPIAEFPRYLPLLGHLLGSGEWRLLHCDGASALLSRRKQEAVLEIAWDPKVRGGPILGEIRRRYPSHPRLQALACRNVADLFAAAGRSDLARAWLDQASLTLASGGLPPGLVPERAGNAAAPAPVFRFNQGQAMAMRAGLVERRPR